MTPTPKLRFVECDGPIMGFHKSSDGTESTICQKIRILQQWWAPEGATYNEVKHELAGEWRDVPHERE